MLNGKHLILKNFDIIAEVGSSTAHEKRIHFSIIDEGSKLIFGNEESRIIDSSIGIQFLRVFRLMKYISPFQLLLYSMYIFTYHHRVMQIIQR